MELGELEHVDGPADPGGQEGRPFWVKHATQTGFCGGFLSQSVNLCGFKWAFLAPSSG